MTDARLQLSDRAEQVRVESDVQARELALATANMVPLLTPEEARREREWAMAASGARFWSEKEQRS